MAYPLADVSPTAAIQAVYIGYYTRAADPQGFEFWLDLYQEHLNGPEDGDPGLSLVEIANDFATQAETKAAYPFFEAPNLVDAESFITEVYANLFDREPDTAGLNFWAAQLAANPANAGQIVLQIIEGATNELGDIDTLENKIEAATYWSQQAASNSVGTASNPIAEENEDGQLVILDPEAFQSAKESVQGEGDDGFGQDDLDASKDATDAFIASLTTMPSPVDETIILTGGVDVETAGEGNDTFVADQNTLNNADDLDGAGGDDILEVSVQSGDGSLFASPTLANIETVQVNGPNLENGQDITIDLSNATGYETLRSFQTTVDGSMGPMPVVSFLDIQDVNNTDLEIIDTDVDHLFTYDSNAYESLFGAAAPGAPNGGEDTAELLLQEVNGSDITLANENAVPDTPGGDFRSHVDTVSIDSQARSQVNTTSFNFVQSLTVGPVFTTLEVQGNADLEIEEFLEGPTSTGPNPEDVIGGVNTVEATALDGDLALDLIGQGVREPLSKVVGAQTLFNVTGGDNPFNPDGNLNVFGAMGDNRIDVSGDTNGTFLFQGGDDLLRVGNSSDTDYVREDVFGDLVVGTGAGDDGVILNITGEQTVNLGDDDDELVINGNVDDLSTLPFNDGRSVIEAGAGHDEVRLNGQSVFGIAVEDLDNDYLIDLGEGNDTLIATQGGDHEVTGGAGGDNITITGNGDQDIDSGDGHDSVEITGDGVHNVDLGGGNDSLTIMGSRLPDNNIDNTFEDRQTIINGGDGDDTILVDGDHYLLVDLGAGDDSIELNADELTSDDAIDGNEGVDTLILNNNSGSVQSGLVGRSETSGVTGVEVFDLRDSNITLLLSSDNFDTAQDGDILVRTTGADRFDLPLDNLFNGMTREQYRDVADFFFSTDGSSTAEEVQLLNDLLLTRGVSAINFEDENADGDKATIVNLGQNFLFGDPSDTVEFHREISGAQTIDITNIPMSIASGRNFELQGGNIQDIVIADDASIGGRLVLAYDFSTDTAHSVEDTLRVVDGAQITAADLRNVSGLEIIELTSSSNDAQVWGIELNDRVINQTSGNADLIIRVDPQVPAGSEVYIQLDPSIWSSTATKNVVIENVSNAEIYIDGVLVSEPDYDSTDYNPSPLASIIVTERHLFTENTDSLFGSDSTYTFTSIDQIQSSDSVEDKLNSGTLLGDGVAVSNETESLYEQLNTPQLSGINEIVFDTGMNVQMLQLDSGADNGKLTGGFINGSDLDILRTGSGNDELSAMEAIGSNLNEGYFLGGGNDFFSTDKQGSDYFVDAGAGNDRAVVQDGDTITATDFELIELGINSGAILRTVVGTDGGTMTVLGTEGSKMLPSTNPVILATSIEAAAGGLATVVLRDIEVTIDNGGDNNIDLDNDVTKAADGDAQVDLNGGIDTLTVTNVDELVVEATTGVKAVDVGGGFPASNVNDFYYTGGVGAESGVDNIVAVIDDDAIIETGGDDDFINILSTNGGAVTVDGGAGDDLIFAESIGAGGTLDLNGGTGNDQINVTTIGGETSSIDSGLGLDEINLNVSGGGGEDTVVFGDIIYTALQSVSIPSTTQNFVQSGVDSGNWGGTANDGIDVINGFNMEGMMGAGDEDILDVSAFIAQVKPDNDPLTTAADFNYGDWTGGAFTAVFSGGGDQEIAVIAVDNGFELDGSHISVNGSGLPGVRIGDNEGRVVITAYDTDGDNAFDTADLYFVQDVDDDAGQAWAVDKVATINFATEIGAVTSIDEDNFFIS